MMIRRMILVLWCCGMAAVLPVCAKTLTMAEFMQGTAAPDEIPAKSLDGTWSKMHVEIGGPQPLSALFSFAARSMGAQTPPATTYYTRGDKLIMGGTQFLIAYQKPADVLNGEEIDAQLKVDVPKEPALMEMLFQQKNPLYQALTAETVLTMTLINLSTVGILSAIKPIDQATELPGPAQRSQLKHLQSQRYLRMVVVMVLEITKQNDGKLPQDLETISKRFAPRWLAGFAQLVVAIFHGIALDTCSKWLRDLHEASGAIEAQIVLR